MSKQRIRRQLVKNVDQKSSEAYVEEKDASEFLDLSS
jgi:hypothetical protein